MAATAAGCVAAAYGVAGGVRALQPVLDAAGARGSRASIWRLSGLPVEATGRFSFVVIAGLVFVVLLLGLRNASAFWLAGAVVLGFLLTAQYVLPWYVAWGLPVLALVWRSRLPLLAAVQAALLELAYVPIGARPVLFHVYYARLVPLCSGRSARRPRRPRRTDATTCASLCGRRVWGQAAPASEAPG